MMEKIPIGKTTQELWGRVEKGEKEPVAKVTYDQENLDKLIKGSQPKEKPPFASMLEEEITGAMRFAGYEPEIVKLFTAVGSPARAHAFVEFSINGKSSRPDRVNLSLVGRNIGLHEKGVVFNFDQELDPVADRDSGPFRAKIKEVSVRTVLKEMRNLDENKKSVLGEYVLKSVTDIVYALRDAKKSEEGMTVVGDIIEETKMIDFELASRLIETLKTINLERQ